MIEFACESLTGLAELRVYPTLPDDATADYVERANAAAGYVAALLYWPENEEGLPPVWGVRVNIAFRYPMARHESKRLSAAIARCWEWIDAQ